MADDSTSRARSGVSDISPCRPKSLYRLPFGTFDQIFLSPITSVVFSNSLDNLGVIPGKLAIASATRNPGKLKNFCLPAFAGMTMRHSLYLRTLVDPPHFTFYAVDCDSDRVERRQKPYVH
jgi:hypothetical protein